MTKPTITERGWPAHFICADRCAFRRNTLVKLGERRIVVSTVGAMRARSDIDIERIGVDRYYETMAFEAVWQDPYWEADVSRQVEFEGQWAVDHLERHCSLDANTMHDEAVAQVAAMVEAEAEKYRPMTRTQKIKRVLERLEATRNWLHEAPIEELEAIEKALARNAPINDINEAIETIWSLEGEVEKGGGPVAHEYAFDIQAFGTLRINADSQEEAEKILDNLLDCASVNYGSFPDGSPAVGELSAEDYWLFEVDGEGVD